ncbi:MAG: hypothetical protein KDF65_10820 [Anaerolineae bacterium]|nr:hypothetical protein [Anaerolineae bacterium]
MTRSQALIVGILFGFVVLVFFGAVALFFIPFEVFAPAPPTIAIDTPLPPQPTPTATFPNFLPTALPDTPVAEPSPTNTRLPTLTPTPLRTATPTVVIELNYPQPKATDTPVPSNTPPPQPPTLAPSPVATQPLSRQYNISFEADDTRIDEGDCTFLRWRVDGALEIELDGQRVGRMDRDEVCPTKRTTYELTIQLPDGVQARRQVTIEVEEVDENDAQNDDDN